MTIPVDIDACWVSDLVQIPSGLASSNADRNQEPMPLSSLHVLIMYNFRPFNTSATKYAIHFNLLPSQTCISNIDKVELTTSSLKFTCNYHHGTDDQRPIWPVTFSRGGELRALLC